LLLLVFADALTRAIPALTRSWIIARSNSANTPIIWKSALPPGVDTLLLKEEVDLPPMKVREEPDKVL